MPSPKPVTLTTVTENPTPYEPEPLVVVGGIPGATDLPAVPETFADLAAVKTYLDSLVAALES